MDDKGIRKPGDVDVREFSQDEGGWTPAVPVSALAPGGVAAVQSPYPTHPSKIYQITAPEGLGVVAMLGIALAFWWWLFPTRTTIESAGEKEWMVLYAVHTPGVVVPIFFALLLGICIAHFRVSKVELPRVAWVGAGLIMIGAMPFALFTPNPVFFGLFWADILGMILWFGLASRTLVATRPSADLIADVVNQGLVVPTRNAGAFFAGLRSLTRGNKRVGQVVIALVGLLIAAPIIALVVILLASADQSFSSWITVIMEALATVNLWSFTWRLVLAIPLAAYLFALAWGNLHRVDVDTVTRESLGRAGLAARRIPLAAIVTPLVVLTCIYFAFFAAMSTYLFSAFSGALPDGFTYAEYARRGFFELSLVAAINLCVVGGTYLFTRREEKYPMVLRVLGVTLSVFTCALIATAISKMAMYVSAYGFTQLRLYTLVFMAMLAVIFVLVTVWHIRPFRVSGPVVVIAAATLVGLCWVNTDGFIARYNVDRYLAGEMKETIDVSYLGNHLGEAAAPALADLVTGSGVSEVVEDARKYLAELEVYGLPVDAADQAPWMTWNLQSHLTLTDPPE